MFDSSPIAAIATAPGRAGIGIVRLSGKNLWPVIQDICYQDETSLIPRYATYLPFRHANGHIIDYGLALYFKAPHSYTGEDVLELQGHGGPVVMQMLLARCLEAGAQIGLRLAAPGEFTQRAFLNNKLDLAQAEAVADLIEASTTAAAKSAAESLSGAFSNAIQALIDQLTHLRILVEASLDFPEEEIDFLRSDNAHEQLSVIDQTLADILAHAAQGALLRNGLKVVLIGQANVGKSSLLNALAGSDIAIVTPIAGTTRDKITETIQIEGVPLQIIDTAGIRDSHVSLDEVERIGIDRTWAAAMQADVILHLLDVSHGFTTADGKMVERFPETIPVIRIWNKIDLSGYPPAIEQKSDHTSIYLSAITHLGIDLLRTELLRIAGWQQTIETRYLARERHLTALKQARIHIKRAEHYVVMSNNQSRIQSLDLFAEELRLAQESLNHIVGKLTSDDLLGAIFSQFCIGK